MPAPSKEQFDALASKIMDNVRPNPVTGKVEFDDIGRYLLENMGSCEYDQLMNLTDQLSKDHNSKDFTNFDFNSLKSTIKKDTLYFVGLIYQGHFDSSGKEVPTEKVAYVADAHAVYGLTCLEGEKIRGYENCVNGLPKSDFVLKFLRSTFANPLPPFKPALPSELLLDNKLHVHIDALRPFLDSLPKPLHWSVESREAASQVKDIAFEEKQELISRCMAMANHFKEKGNQSFKAGKRKEALDLYQHAIDSLFKIFGAGDPDEEQVEKASRWIAVCRANRAATWLLNGEGKDAEKALEEAKMAENLYPGYAKGYFRQACAFQALGKLAEAQDAVVRGLKRSELERDTSLADVLIELQTDGKGLPEDLGSFNEWFSRITETDVESAKRLKGLKGAWLDKCDQHRRKMESQATPQS
ncbi:hypothetical protein E1B28_007863 [Marasmius oreades]|uniref:Uncharacterized protein n=1 Tax=Marasmius oreades TaxID=181124 RepID=A0A9P7S2K6_9AGAR|nr:uncharacterized protein E1B28_007863 [Marasmius oreades]KAG7094259.1 hypothetical protein E1B28_007863 [Marasmius oreades]